MVKPKYGAGAGSALSQGIKMPSNMAMMKYQGDLARTGSAQLKTAQEISALESDQAILTDRNSGVFKLVGDEYQLRDDWLEQNNKLSGNANFGNAVGMNALGGGYYKRGIRGNPKKVTNRAVFAPQEAAQGVVPTALLDRIEAETDSDAKAALEAQAARYKLPDDNENKLRAYVTPAINADRKFALLNRFGTDSPDDVPLAFSQDEIEGFYRARADKLNLDRQRLKPGDAMEADLRANAEDQPLLASRGVGVEGYTTQGVGDTVTPESDLGGAKEELLDMVFDPEVGREDTLFGLKQLKELYAQNPLVTTPAPYEEEYQETITDPKVQEGIDFNDEKARIFKEINRERSNRNTRFPLLTNAGKLEELLPSLKSIQEGDLSDMRYPTTTGLYNFWKSKTGNEGKTRIGKEWQSVMNSPEELKVLAAEYETGIKQQISNAGYDLRYLEDYQQGDATTTGGTTTVTKTRTVTPDPITTPFEEAFPELVGLTGDALDNAVQGLIQDGRFDTILTDTQRQAIMEGFEKENVGSLSEFATKEESKPDFDPAKSYNKLYVAYSMMATNGVLPNGQTVKQATDIAFNEYFTGGTVSINKSTGALQGDTIQNIADRRVEAFDANTSRMVAETDRLDLITSIQATRNEAYSNAATAVREDYDEIEENFATRIKDEILPDSVKFFDNIKSVFAGEGFLEGDNYISQQAYQTSLKSATADYVNEIRDNEIGRANYAKGYEMWAAMYQDGPNDSAEVKAFNKKMRDSYYENDEIFTFYSPYGQPPRFMDLKNLQDQIPIFKLYNSFINKAFWFPGADTGRLMDFFGDIPAEDRDPAAILNALQNTVGVRYVNGKPAEIVSIDSRQNEQEEGRDLTIILEKNFLSPSELHRLLEVLPATTNSTMADGSLVQEGQFITGDMINTGSLPKAGGGTGRVNRRVERRRARREKRNQNRESD